MTISYNKLWQDQLLDLGKRNRMISYRESKRSTLRLVSPNFQTLYKRIVIDEEELTFQKTIDRHTDRRTHAILTLLTHLDDAIDVRTGNICTAMTLPESAKTLKNLRSKANLALYEQGTNILYLVFGFLECRSPAPGGIAGSVLRCFWFR